MSDVQAGVQKSRDENSSGTRPLYCPSAQPGVNGSMIIGLVQEGSGTAAVKMLPHPVKVSPGTLSSLVVNNLGGTDLFRFASRCQTDNCMHWQGGTLTCGVAAGLIQILPAADYQIPDCALRFACRWYAQEGSASCRRCVQIVTHDQHLIDDLLHFESLDSVHVESAANEGALSIS
jgi:hypothetical protein